MVWKLIRTLPEIVNFTAKFFQGIDPLWEKDSNFKEMYEDNRKNILLDKIKAYVLYKFIKYCSNLKGDFAELGVYKGGGCKLISLTNKMNKKIYGFDTFEGFPELDKQKNPTWKAGQLNDAPFEQVKKYINDDNVILIKGVFPETVKDIPENTQFSFIHIDTDLYEGTLAGCEYFYDKIIPGGVLLVDDYGFLSCPGVDHAINEFFDNKSEEILLPNRFKLPENLFFNGFLYLISNTEDILSPYLD